MLSLLLLAPVEGSAVTVEGVGYPPIRTENRAQARLMARRAAILDAYRKVLKIESGGGLSEEFYRGLAGFVRGARVVREEYLSDGGVIVTLEVGSGEVSGRTTSGPGTETGKPERVTVEEWYRVIEKVVVYTDKREVEP